MTPVAFLSLFAEFRAASWDAWRAVLARITDAIRELYVIAGRGSGKSRVAAVLAVCFAAREYRRAPGESIYIGLFAPDRRQAALVFRYVVGLLRSEPTLATLITNEKAESVELANGVVIEVITAGTAAPRGRSYALAIVEEAAFLPDGDSAEPDVELLRALRPALGRVPGSLLVVIGSPYAPRGVLYDAWKVGDSEERIVVSASTAALNPTFSAREIARAWRDDPEAARSEYGADGVIEFRSDVSALLASAALAAVVPVGVRELPPEDAVAVAHFDAATGSGEDAAALGIAYKGTPARLALVRQWRPPFDPAAVIREAADCCAEFCVTTITVDRFAPGLVDALFREHGIRCRVAEKDTSAAFGELLTLVNSRQAVLLDDAALLRELSRLERRPGSGRDVIGHPPRGHDDVAAAAAFALVSAAHEARRPRHGLLFVGDDSGPADETLDDELARLERELGLAPS